MRPRAAHTAPVALLFVLGAFLAGCSVEEPPHIVVPGGDPGAGRIALGEAGCGACHVIPGVPGAHGLVGPPLDAFARRVYIAGEFPNQPAWLVAWIRDPPALVPETAMPDVGVSEASARDMAAYLYELH